MEIDFVTSFVISFVLSRANWWSKKKISYFPSSTNFSIHKHSTDLSKFKLISVYCYVNFWRREKNTKKVAWMVVFFVLGRVSRNNSEINRTALINLWYRGKAEKWMRSSWRNVFFSRGENFFNSPELAERGERKMKFINKKEKASGKFLLF